MAEVRLAAVLAAAPVALAALTATAPPASAQQSEAAAFHAHSRVGGRICMSEHEHYGEGTLPSRGGAENAARRAWTSFTTWEYGRPWGSYANAAGQRMDCAQSGGLWTCKTTARPCRR